MPADLRIRRILLPVRKRTCGRQRERGQRQRRLGTRHERTEGKSGRRTWGIPCESRRMTPICEGERPLRASLVICSTTSSGLVLSQLGGVRR